jgi:GNAT superfamily N-acetyltransferase
LSYTIQHFSDEEISQTDEIMKHAYRTSPYSRRKDLERYLRLLDSLPLVAKEGPEVLGFGAALDYGPFAYIGLMAVSPKSQRRGIGGAILRNLVEWLNSRSCPTILLDASPFGEPLYAKNGFVGLDLTNVFKRTATSSQVKKADDSVRPYSSKDLPEIVSFDRPLFGAERSALLRSFFSESPNRSYVSRDKEGKINGFLVAQARSIGPWVASDASSAENLLQAGLGHTYEDSPSVIVSALNKDCLEILAHHGFEIQRSNRHMRMGGEIERARSTKIFGQATMGYG